LPELDDGCGDMNLRVHGYLLIIILLALFQGGPAYPGNDAIIDRCNELLKLNRDVIKADLEMIERGDAVWYGLETDTPWYYYAVRDYLETGEYAPYLTDDFDNDDHDETALACKNRDGYYVVIFRNVRNKWYRFIAIIRVRGMFYLSRHGRSHDIKVCYFPDTDDFDVISWDGKNYAISARPQSN